MANSYHKRTTNTFLNFEVI